MGRERGPEYRQARTEELLDAAAETVRRLGPAWSVDHVAAEVGVARQVLYRYFRSREGLARALADRVTGRLATAVLAAVGGAAPGRPMVRAAVGAYLAFIEAEPDLYRFAVHHQTPVPAAARERHDRRRRPAASHPIEARGTDVVDAVGRGVAVVIGDQLRAAGRDTGPAEAWAYALVGMVGVAGEWWLGRRTLGRDALADYLTDLVWDGLAGGAPA